jgi:hypothetical protein
MNSFIVHVITPSQVRTDQVAALMHTCASRFGQSLLSCSFHFIMLALPA